MCAIKKKIMEDRKLNCFETFKVFSIQPCIVWEDDISDSDICLNFYTIRKLRDFRTKCKSEILWRLIFLYFQFSLENIMFIPDYYKFTGKYDCMKIGNMFCLN